MIFQTSIHRQGQSEPQATIAPKVTMKAGKKINDADDFETKLSASNFSIQKASELNEKLNSIPRLPASERKVEANNFSKTLLEEFKSANRPKKTEFALVPVGMPLTKNDVLAFISAAPTFVQNDWEKSKKVAGTLANQLEGLADGDALTPDMFQKKFMLEGAYSQRRFMTEAEFSKSFHKLLFSTSMGEFEKNFKSIMALALSKSATDRLALERAAARVANDQSRTFDFISQAMPPDKSASDAYSDTLEKSKSGRG